MSVVHPTGDDVPDSKPSTIITDLRSPSSGGPSATPKSNRGDGPSYPNASGLPPTPKSNRDDGPPGDIKEAERFIKLLRQFTTFGMGPNSSHLSTFLYLGCNLACCDVFFMLSVNDIGFRPMAPFFLFLCVGVYDMFDMLYMVRHCSDCGPWEHPKDKSTIKQVNTCLTDSLIVFFVGHFLLNAVPLWLYVEQERAKQGLPSLPMQQTIAMAFFCVPGFSLLVLDCMCYSYAGKEITRQFKSPCIFSNSSPR